MYTRKLKTILQSRYLFKILVIIFIIYALLITNLYHFKSAYKEGNINEKLIVDKYTIDGDKLTLYLNGKEKLIGTYYIKTESEKEYYQNNLELGMTLKIEGTLKTPSNNTVPNLFNYKKYLYNNHIHYLINIDNIKITKKNTKILYHIKNILTKRIDKIDNTGYLRTFIIADKQIMDTDTLTNYQTNGVSHLFSISGMHISLIATILLFIFKKISYNNYFIYGIVISFLIFYLFLTGMQASILRATIMYIVLAINKCLNLKIKNIDLMLTVLILIIIIDPLLIYNIGFQFSYLISFTLVLLSKKINNHKKYITKSLYISFISFLVSLPICIYNFYQINFLSIILNLILIPLVSIFVFPLSILSFIFPFFYKILLIFITLLEYINDLSSKIDIFILVLSKPNLIAIVIYYTIIYLSIYNYKFLIILLVMITIHKNIVYLDNKLHILIMDVSQGDSIIIKFPNSSKVILIDTGGTITYSKEKWQQRKKEYSIANSKTIPYLKSIGITKIEYLITTHGDYDHMGEAINLITNFKVNNIIFNKGEYNNLEQNLIKEINTKNIKYKNNISKLSINGNILYFLKTEIYDDENSNSNIIYLNYKNYKLLLMADATCDNELEIIKNYNLKNIDFLKVGHHGSNTSSCKEFIDSINPKISLISVGLNNRYNHPKQEVLDNLSNSKVYRTDIDGSIEINITNKYKIYNYAP